MDAASNGPKTPGNFLPSTVEQSSLDRPPDNPFRSGSNWHGIHGPVSTPSPPTGQAFSPARPPMDAASMGSKTPGNFLPSTVEQSSLDRAPGDPFRSGSTLPSTGCNSPSPPSGGSAAPHGRPSPSPQAHAPPLSFFWPHFGRFAACAGFRRDSRGSRCGRCYTRGSA